MLASWRAWSLAEVTFALYIVWYNCTSYIYKNISLYKSCLDKLFELFHPDDPDQVNSDIAPSGTVCQGSTVQFTCTADANPPVHTYVLFKNGTMDSTNEFGTWTKIMNSSGKFVFKCEAHSSKGNGTSKDTLLNVDGETAGP